MELEYIYSFCAAPFRACKPHIYALTKDGAQALADLDRRDRSEILYPKGGIQFAGDCEHRQGYIDLCIAFDARAAASEDRRVHGPLHYPDKTGSNRQGIASRPMTRIDLGRGEHIVPDGLAAFEVAGKRRPVALEFHRQTRPRTHCRATGAAYPGDCRGGPGRLWKRLGAGGRQKIGHFRVGVMSPNVTPLLFA